MSKKKQNKTEEVTIQVKTRENNKKNKQNSTRCKFNRIYK